MDQSAKIIDLEVEQFLARRKEGTSLLDPNFPHQTNAILSKAKKKAYFCTRRAAKSYTGGLEIFKTMQDFPRCNALYVGLTRSSAKGIIWKDVFEDINRKNNLGCGLNLSELTVTTPQGSVCHVTGIDADPKEMEKLLGKKYKIVFLDEASLYSVDLRKFAYGIIDPALTDEDGTLLFGGTAGDLTQGLFFDITNGKEPGWELHQWTANDNPYVRKNWVKKLDEIRTTRPAFMETPLFKQWYLNQWVIDENKLVYRFAHGRNEYQALPQYRSGQWQFVLGVDLGYDPDPSAFVVCAFHENDSNLYVLECFKKNQMDVTDVANKIKWYQSRFPVFKVIIDGSNKQAVAEMQLRHELALTAADKREKSDFIQLMNGELIQGKIKLSSDCKELKDEALSLIWVVKDDTIVFPRKENPNCENHLCDAWLYAWRFCYPFMAEPMKKLIDLRKPEHYLEHTQKLMEDNLQRQIDQQESDERGEDIFNTGGMDDEVEVLSYFLNKRRK